MSPSPPTAGHGDDCWPSFAHCLVHVPSRRPAAEVPKSIPCLTKPGCVLMHGHLPPCSYDPDAAPVLSPKERETP